MSNLNTLKANIIADGNVDAEEVSQMRTELYADGIIDAEEANWLFEINDATSNGSHHESWPTFFAEAVGDYVLKDERSPGVIDEEEGKWLMDRIEGDGTVDAREVALLTRIKRDAISIEYSPLQELIDIHVN